MKDEPKAPSKAQDKNPFCHAGMACHDGCRCASADGICHCPMISERKCRCDGFCGMRK